MPFLASTKVTSSAFLHCLTTDGTVFARFTLAFKHSNPDDVKAVLLLTASSVLMSELFGVF